MIKWFREMFMTLREQDEEWMREQVAKEIKEGDDKAALHIASGKLNVPKQENLK